MTTTFCMAAHKGGAGKTSSTVSLADEFGRRGYKTLIIDLDPQSNASLHIGPLNPYFVPVTANQVMLAPTGEVLQSAIYDTVLENVSIIYGSMPRSGPELEMQLMFSCPRPNEVLKNKIDLLDGVFDVILIDTPPALGLRTKNALAASSYVIIPQEGSDQSGIHGLADLMYVINEMKVINPSLQVVGALLNRFDKRKTMCQLIENQAREIVGSVIPVRVGDTTKMPQATAFKQSIRQIARTHSVTKDYSDIVEWLITECKIEKLGDE